jgi:hypothetical protein
LAVAERRRRLGDIRHNVDPEAPPESRAASPHEADLFGLAFSGGGIRSATFCLGVLQVLARMGLLRKVDFLSTVSGGGYIGSWLTALLWRRAQKHQEAAAFWTEVEGALGCSRRPAAADGEAPEIGWLRRYSNYLSPNPAMFSADFWAMIMVWFRNTLLNLLVLSTLLAAVVLTPRLWRETLFPASEGWRAGLRIVYAISLAGVVVALALARGRLFRLTQAAAAGLATVLSIGAVLLSSLWFGGDRLVPPEYIGYGAALILLGIGVSSVWEKGWEGWLSALLGALFGGMAFAWLSARLASMVHDWAASPGGGTEAITFAPPGLLFLFALAITGMVGMLGISMEDLDREWWSRVGAWIALVGGAAMALSMIALYGPGWLRLLERGWHWALGGTWLTSGALSLMGGRSARSSGKGTAGVLDKVLSVLPYVFVLGILLLVSAGLEVLTAGLGALQLLAAVFLCAGLCALLAWRIDINEFSMHAFYRNRLVRAYLGASRKRDADPFTDFDPADDLALSSLYPQPSPTQTNPRKHWGPFPIVNAAINISSGLSGTQERRAAGFAMTPFTSGFSLERESMPRYGATADLMSNCGGLRLGTAVAISGAAASPNMGYHTSAPLAFLMTVFNVRLGWWMPNPTEYAKPKLGAWKRSGPAFGILPLIRELAASASDNSRYVYLSDGGHFENLAVYELLRRRCRFIICCDAEEDAEFKFQGLGGLVRKAREDFGVEIDINTTPISVRDEKGLGRAHAVVGTIRYPEAERGGTLLYLKSSVTGDEPADVLEYRQSNPTFPHQTTGDQFFTESQFESYRRLGEHVAKRALDQALDERGLLPAKHDGSIHLSQVFLEMRRAWQLPPLEPPPASPETWGGRLEALHTRLREDARLAFLHAQFCPEWTDLRGTPEGMWWPLEDGPFAAAFLLCLDILRLMEEVHAALRLEERMEHPDCRGWMNQFMRWCGSDMLRLTYTVAAGTLNGRFQSFARRMLGLKAADITVGQAEENARYNEYELDLQAGLKEWAKPLGGSPACHPVYLHFEPLFASAMGLAAGGTVPVTVGFAMVSKDSLVWLRIRNHLRRMGLGRQAILELTGKGQGKGLTTSMVPIDCFDATKAPWWESRTPWFHEWARRYVPVRDPGTSGG